MPLIISCQLVCPKSDGNKADNAQQHCGDKYQIGRHSGCRRGTTHLCITAAAGTELAVPSSFATINRPGVIGKALLANDRGLRAEAIHPPRGVAPSGFPPLRKILDCCHP